MAPKRQKAASATPTTANAGANHAGVATASDDKTENAGAKPAGVATASDGKVEDAGNATDVAARPLANVATTPRAWSDTFLGDFSAGNAEDYGKEVYMSVSARLCAYLSRSKTVGGIGLKGPLHAQQPIDVANAQRNANLKSYKEAWRCTNCKISLDASSIY